MKILIYKFNPFYSFVNCDSYSCSRIAMDNGFNIIFGVKQLTGSLRYVMAKEKFSIIFLNLLGLRTTVDQFIVKCL